MAVCPSRVSFIKKSPEMLLNVQKIERIHEKDDATEALKKNKHRHKLDTKNLAVVNLSYSVITNCLPT